MTFKKSISQIKYLAIGLLLAIAVPLPTMVSAAVGDVPEAEKLIDHTIENVLPIFRENQERLANDSGYMEGVLREHVIPKFDVDAISRWILGKHWRRLKPEQQQEFQALFINMLIRSYGNQLLQYVESDISITGSTLAKRKGFAIVDVVIEGGKLPASQNVKYRLRQQDDSSWLLMDVVANGISVLVNFRSVMGDIISSKGFDVLLERMRSGDSLSEGS